MREEIRVVSKMFKQYKEYRKPISDFAANVVGIKLGRSVLPDWP